MTTNRFKSDSRFAIITEDPSYDHEEDLEISSDDLGGFVDVSQMSDEEIKWLLNSD
jgi:hypothetical protein